MAYNYKAYIFDFDGTLYDNKKMGFYLCSSDLLHIHMIGAERTARKNLRGIDFESKEDFLKNFYSVAAKVSRVSVERFAKWYEKRYTKNLDKVLRKHYKAFPRTGDVFKKLRTDGAKLCVFSDYCMVNERLKAIDLSPSDVDYTIDAEECGALKPAVSPFIKAAEMMQVDPKDVLVIGDRLSTDGLGAVNSGMNFLQIDTSREEKSTAQINGKDYPSMRWEHFAAEVLG